MHKQVLDQFVHVMPLSWQRFMSQPFSFSHRLQYDLLTT